MNEENYFKLLGNEIARLNKEIEVERMGISAITNSDDAEKCRSRLARLVEESYRSTEILQQNYKKLSLVHKY